MNFKNNLVKLSAVTALSVAGVAAVNSTKTDTVQAATVSNPGVVTVSYKPGWSIAVWNSYEAGKPTGQYLKENTAWKVLSTAVSSNGETWYEVGANQWIPAKYVVAGRKTASSQASTKASAVVALASAQLGKSYVWGGNGPTGFDCSGLVSYVFANAAGKSFGRTTYQQVYAGTSVSMNNLQPGDLLFWGSASAPYHVGIYVGNGQYIHASSPTTGVIKSTLSSYFYPSVAKRVL